MFKRLRSSCALKKQSSRNKRAIRRRRSYEPLEKRVVLAGFLVNTMLDTVDINPGDGFAADSNGFTSLRAAIMEANALAGPDTITLPADNYLLSIPGGSEDAAATGDLDVVDDLTITGAGANQTTIDANRLDRVFHVRSAAFLLDGVTVTNGLAQGTGADGGGILGSFSDIEIRNSAITANQAADGGSFGGSGGGIFVSGNTLTIDNSIIEGNVTGDGTTIGGSGGGVGANVTTIDIRGSEVRNNRTGDGSSAARAGGGAGINFENGNPQQLPVLTIENTIIAVSYTHLTLPTTPY